MTNNHVLDVQLSALLEPALQHVKRHKAANPTCHNYDDILTSLQGHLDFLSNDTPVVTSPVKENVIAKVEKLTIAPSLPTSHDIYASPFNSRYCADSPLLTLLSSRHKIETWRQLWVWLAQAQMNVGLKNPHITPDMIAELQSAVTDIDWNYARDAERRTRHDVMAHIETFQQKCPTAHGILHLGATSCFVQDNADLIVYRECSEHILTRLTACLLSLRRLSSTSASTPTVGRTHYQAASITTVGKRAAMWTQELLFAFRSLKLTLEKFWAFRGIAGATGTQDTFLTLFDGDSSKVEALDVEVARLASFDTRLTITGQTYPRTMDILLLNALSLAGSAVHRICMDMRMLQDKGEMLEPFESTQIGSSAMPYKRNPMRAERACGFARYLMSLPNNAVMTAAIQGFERTLDDSSNRRIVLPDAFLCCEAMLLTFQNIFEGVNVISSVTSRHVADELPFLALEKVLMQLTKLGKSRQEAHDKIRTVSLAAKERQQNGEQIDLMSMLAGDEYFDCVRTYATTLVDKPLLFAGRCVEQVGTFNDEQLDPAIQEYVERAKGMGAKLNV